MNKRIKSELELLKRGVAELVSEEELAAKLRRSYETGKPLKIKYGADPTAPDIHIGHSVPLRKMRQFQELGHEIYFIIGDFTGMIGDPSERAEMRKMMTREEVEANAQTYRDQIFKILDPERTKVVFNSAWLSKLRFEDILQLTARMTVARMLERSDFHKRYKEERPIGIVEFLYPISQAYDSIHLKTDLELGGTDQTFNFMMTRDMMRAFDLEPQCVLTMPLLEGLDGVKKMSKSLGNYIGIAEPPEEIFGKTMSISDDLMWRYYELLTNVPQTEINEMKRGIEKGALNPRDVKKKLSRYIVTQYNPAQAADRAETYFETKHGGMRLSFEERTVAIKPDIYEIDPGDMKDGKLWLPKALVLGNLAKSNSDARRKITQGGVRINDEKIDDANFELPGGATYIIQAGKRHYAKLILP